MPVSYCKTSKDEAMSAEGDYIPSCAQGRDTLHGKARHSRAVI